MGNCCCPETIESQALTGRQTQAFQGQGHRLGTTHEPTTNSYQNTGTTQQPPNQQILEPPPPIDPTLSAAERAQIRADRAKAAEARIQQQLGTKAKKKKPSNNNEPLRGPNSKNTMTWTL